jgi:hypothetical protein
MAEASSPLETSVGYMPPYVTQFSVFLDNRVGKLHELLRAFGNASVQVCALSVHDASDHAVVRMITNDRGETKQLLLRHQMPFTQTDMLMVELGHGKTLERLCMYLLGAELNIRFAYPLMHRPNGAPTIAIAVDDLLLAGQILRRKEFRLFGEGDLPKGAG